ncbi:helicase-associated domain-containing protein [Streptomyces meridianus]|uniref:Helicase C-terminal domain-containing protein n=1 Tax=Streptomyces meridianus TaxID=2938945 RepID=A0ABT0X2U9_9ACTN|nr:helicase-associated domain-containing protein [Streptomyces meridianus]MCM2576866.1 helicase C-terminal domain-containing protein [Streptomyces meridianus]
MTTERNREARVPEETRRGGSGPRTLAEELRTRPDEELTALLRARPDLLNPVPNDLTQLATRAGTRASVVRALERLDRFALQTAEALAVAPDPCPSGTLLTLMTGDDGDDTIAGALPRAVATLRTQALVWGGADRLHLVRTARELLSPGGAGSRPASPTGLGPTVADACAGMSPGRLQEILAAAGLPATHDPVTAVASLTALFADRRRMADLLAQAPPEAQATLERLTWGPPYGTVPATPAPPVRWLTARGLLLPAGTGTVVLPREAALHLRGGRAHRSCEPLPPEVVAAAEHRTEVVDTTAAGQAHVALVTVEELLQEWDTGGPAVLRAGGLGARDLKRAATALDLPEPTAAFWIELAHSAGLLASDGEADERFAPTPGYDEWRALPAEERWEALAAAWLTATRTSGVVGGQDAKGRVLSVLGPGLDRSAAPEVRARVLELLASLPEGTTAEPESLLARLRWEHGLPREEPAGAVDRPERVGPGRAGRTPRGNGGAAETSEDLRTRLARWTLVECELLGVTGRGALAAHGRALLGAAPADHQGAGPEAVSPGGPARLLAPRLPQPVDHILIQADLTAVAPGPLERPAAEVMGLLADIESKGAATVYRFTPGSVRRALDSGRTASDLHAFLATRSRTPVPQPLSYLIDDVARRHGHLRVGAASSYVRCDDDALLTEIVADRRAGELRLRRLAPTVLAAAAAPDVLLARLRAMGYAPAAEGDEGDVLVTRADAHRTPPRTAPAPVPDGPPVPGRKLLTAAVKAIRAGDLATTAVRVPVPADGVEEGPGTPGEDGRLPRTTSAETLATVQAAALTGGAVCIGYVNADGAASQRVIAPVRVEGGFVTAYDHTSDAVRTYPLHRITGVAELADGAAP